MNNGQKSLSINETFIIEAENDGTMSACTGFYTNALISCDSNVQLLLGNNIIEANSPFSATTFYGDGSNLTGISTQDIFVTGGTYDQNSGIATFINNTGGTFNVTGFYTGATDIYVTAVTFTNNLLTLYRNDGVTFGANIDNFTSLNVDGPVSATTFYGDGSNLSGVSKQDTFVTGGTYSDGVTTFTNNTGGTFSITGPSNYYAGVISGGENWVNNGDGSLDLPEIKVGLFDNANNIEPLRIYTISSGTTGVGGIPPLADNDTNYIIIEYNGGSPRYNILDNDGTVTSSDVVLYMIVYRASSFIHTLEFGDMGAGLTNKLNTRLISTDRFARESGCALGLSGNTGIVTLSSGVVWNGPYEQIVSAVNSQDDIFFKSFHSGGTWVYTTTGNTINNNYYDDGTNLVLATAGKYLVNWYFRGQEINDHLYELISYGQYDTVQLAEASPEPNLPELITSHAFLVGRIIVEVSATTGITQSAFNTVFQPSGAPVLHNDLAGIQGGLSGQYYHLDSNKYNNLALTNTNNNFSVGQSFNAGLTATTISATTISTPLTSGSVLFSDGTTIAQDNANLFWDNTNNRLGIGTATPANTLDVNGTARVSGNVFLTNGIIPTIFGNTIFQGSTNYFTHNRIASSGAFGFQISNYSALASFWRWDTGNGDTEFGQAQNYGLNLFTNNLNRLRIVNNGNVLIGTTTDAGYKLDVNGTARVSGNLTIDNLNCNAVRGSFFNTINNVFTVFQTFTASGNAAFYNSVSVGTTATPVSSAVLEAVSTTKGFLPPRMTNTQRLAIASPAIGLIVYCTDATEGFYENTSTGWVNLNNTVTNRQVASYTLALTDASKLVETDVATANDLTIPLNSSVAFPIGTKIDVVQYGAGQTTFVATVGVTIRSANNWVKMNARYGAATLTKIGTDEWYLWGNLNA